MGILRFALIFLGGAVVGAIGAKAASGGEGIRPLVTNLISRGLDAKDSLMGKVETLKENVEDLVAEAHSSAEKRKEQNEEKQG